MSVWDDIRRDRPERLTAEQVDAVKVAGSFTESIAPPLTQISVEPGLLYHAVDGEFLRDDVALKALGL